jgi:hypothetical protein
MNSNKKIYTFCQTNDTDYVAASQEQKQSNRSHICKDILLLLILVTVKHFAPTMSSTVVSKIILNKMAKSGL